MNPTNAETPWFEDDPNEVCKSCGTMIYNDHSRCSGHQNCLPECPVCGGELLEIER